VRRPDVETVATVRTAFALLWCKPLKHSELCVTTV
jgi:hypothetical protein